MKINNKHKNVSVLLLKYHVCFLFKSLPSHIELGVVPGTREAPAPGPSYNFYQNNLNPLYRQDSAHRLTRFT